MLNSLFLSNFRAELSGAQAISDFLDRETAGLWIDENHFRALDTFYILSLFRLKTNIFLYSLT